MPRGRHGLEARDDAADDGGAPRKRRLHRLDEVELDLCVCVCVCLRERECVCVTECVYLCVCV